ncbi:fatty-acid--CoA ligase [Mycolicibacterium sp. 120266]|uniref:fatty-acid--CoA ligase n=1 Tax=Mycolicibacterium sp. 120266 TaxID=3090601 RepID=UPI00299DA378|nr:fatty-acid--CoA ligase [Mycolicibacterium sp. 120266]MDX1873906.1 fatty-acid--CoA ligase [Mycolicibacterium sp. 120266]
MARAGTRDYVFAVEFTVPLPERISTVLDRHQESLVDLGARYAFVYESIVEPGRALVIIGIRSEQPLLNLLRSPYFGEWFDAVGISDFPAVFAGATVERFDLGEPPEPGNEIVVAAVTPVPDIKEFMATVRASLQEFSAADIRRTLVYQAFDNADEVMFLQQLASENTALNWVARSEIAASWLAAAGIGAYPPVFVGRFVHALRFPQPAVRVPR